MGMGGGSGFGEGDGKEQDGIDQMMDYRDPLQDVMGALSIIDSYMRSFVLEGSYLERISPFENSGAAYKNDTFEVKAYDWEADDNDMEQDYNFKWKDFEVTWYKGMGKRMNTNRSIEKPELKQMVDECLMSLR